jgi:hypothetical protein
MAGLVSSKPILAALISEREHASKGSIYNVRAASQQEEAYVLVIEPSAARQMTAIDESLEGCRAEWGSEKSASRGEVLLVNPEAAEIVLRFPQGPLPTVGEPIRLYPHDFLTPLIKLWGRYEYIAAARAVAAGNRSDDGPEPKPLPAEFACLRERQREAVHAALAPSSLIVGPPGTSKTFTVGAALAYLLTRFSNSTVLLVGPTNAAVDAALLATDDWLRMRLGRTDVARSMRRLGSRFDMRKYRDRQHLLEPDVYEAATKIAMLELEEPPRSDLKRYMEWRKKLDQAREALRTDVIMVAQRARLVAVTTTSAYIWYDALREARHWYFVVCDEASQVTMPGALMVGALAKQAVFVGDPNQLSPIVQNPSPGTQRLLERTVFDIVTPLKRVQLDEQSRMSEPICRVVSQTFYGGELKVCSQAKRDPAWLKARSTYFVDGREVSSIHIEYVADKAGWSPKYNGLLRYDSALVVRAVAEGLLGSYVDPAEIMILTPFKAQRALLRLFFRREPLRSIRIGTVHRSQGSENKVVIFDPVTASTTFLNSEHGRRLINVAVSRAQAPVVLVMNRDDLINPWLRQIHDMALKLRPRDNFAKPFSFQGATGLIEDVGLKGAGRSDAVARLARVPSR